MSDGSTGVIATEAKAAVVTDSVDLPESILVAQDVWVAVQVGKIVKPIVQGGRLTVPTGQILGLVGESGSGKTQFVRSMMGLSSLEPGVISGSAVYNIPGQSPIDVLDEVEDFCPFRPPEGDELYPFRQRIGWAWPLWRRRHRRRLQALRQMGVGFIFQNPVGALNPYMRVGSQLMEAVRVARPKASRKEAEEGALHWLAQVHLKANQDTLALYPHELSGGMAQRVMIALALAGEPHFVVADEPTTGLDSHIRREIVGLLHRIMSKGNLSGIVISHDLPMISRLCDRLTVMFRGKVVEEGPISALGDPTSPSHPYTRELRERAEALALGQHDRGGKAPGESPDSTGSVVAKGCVYRSRCIFYKNVLLDIGRCDAEGPQLGSIAEMHRVACHVHDLSLLRAVRKEVEARGGSRG